MKYLIIYNPNAGGGKARKLLSEVKDELDKYKLDYDLFVTKFAGAGKVKVKGIDFTKYSGGIIAAGGDGTIFEVINGYFNNPSLSKSRENRIPIGVLPIGTGNAFIRDIGIGADNWKDAIKLIANNKTKAIDVGKFSTQNKIYYFINILGLGFVADANRTSKFWKFLGKHAYTVAVLIRTIFLKTDRLKIVYGDDNIAMEKDATFVEISNSRYTGDYLMAPKAILDDGLLDITIATKFSRIALLKSFSSIFTGEHIHKKEIEIFQTNKIIISCDKEDKILTPDGELFGSTPIEVECLHRAVDIYWK